MLDAIRLYRDRFEPSEQLENPYVMLGFNAFVADDEAEAQLLATSVQQAFVGLRSGNASALLPPKPGYLEDLPLHSRAMLDQALSCSAIGTTAMARAAVAEFVDRTGADELMVTAQIYDHAARLRSYELLMDAVA
jgi:alkanesulfonate monooxygenase SsuD/methylene tetrahydromethanopterin reductase-like flavin-dependent oxidoreductase (luciferase family)